MVRNEYTPEEVIGILNSLQDHPGWSLLLDHLELYEGAIIRSLCELGATESVTNYNRGALAMLKDMMDGPIRLTEQSKAVMDEVERRLGTHRPVRRNVPRGL